MTTAPPKKINTKDARFLKEQKYHSTGEIHFIRSEEDLQEVLASAMQSVKIIIELLGKCRSKYSTSTKTKITEFKRLEPTISKLLKQISAINTGLTRMKSGSGKICIPGTCIAMECVSKILTKLVVCLAQLWNKYDKEFMIGVMAQNSRLEMMSEYIIENAMKADDNEMFYKPPTDPVWQELYNGKFIKVETKSSKNFAKKYAEFEQGVLTLTAAGSKGLEKRDISLAGAVSTALNAAYFTVFPSKRKQQAELFLSAPNPKTATKMMNILDSKFTKPLLSIVMPKIAVNKRIYIPKLLPRLTVSNVLLPEDLSKYFTKPYLEAEGAFTEAQKLEKLRLVQYVTTKMKPVPDSHVKVRILSPEILPCDRKGKPAPEKGCKFNRVLIDIHGGGFISTTTRCHQTYLRKWANECNMVIFAIDYKLAPEVKYPSVLDDVWQAYFWIITQAEREFGIKLETVLVAGDSAGGNLAMSLALRTIRSNFRIPDGILLGYPALNLSIRAFTPSLLAAMDDFILRYSFLNVCINSYIPPEADPTKDPYLSPSLIPDEDLKKFPTMRFMVAGRDPLRDESYKLVQRFAKLKKDVQLIEYRMLPHAFWNLDIAFGLEECKFATQQAIEWIAKMFVKHQQDISGSSEDMNKEIDFSLKL